MHVWSIHIYAYQCFICFSLLQSGATPLMVASERGHLSVVKTLLEHSATIDLKDKVWSEHTLYHQCIMFQSSWLWKQQFVISPACLPAYPAACLPICLPTCLPACVSVCLFACVPACLLACSPVCLPAYLFHGQHDTCLSVGKCCAHIEEVNTANTSTEHLSCLSTRKVWSYCTKIDFLSNCLKC